MLLFGKFRGFVAHLLLRAKNNYVNFKVTLSYTDSNFILQLRQTSTQKNYSTAGRRMRTINDIFNFKSF